MIDPLEEITIIEEPEVNLGKDRFTKILSMATATVLIADMIRVYYTQTFCGEAQSIFEILQPINNSNYKNLLLLEAVYTIGFALKARFY